MLPFTTQLIRERSRVDFHGNALDRRHPKHPNVGARWWDHSQILVVEDDLASSALIYGFLDEPDCKVINVTDGTDVLLELGCQDRAILRRTRRLDRPPVQDRDAI